MKVGGIVYLVGGGPGDPGLLTLKGLERLKMCDVVVYDALVSPALLDHCPEKAERIFVGKRRHRHAFEQGEINALMLKHAKEGKRVCRLKGGDPFLFGRGGEEAEFLFQHGIRFEVVPGVSSVIAAPACAGIPLTHRDYASHLAVVTGHGAMDAQGDQGGYGYSPRKTIVVVMGFERLEIIVKKLLDQGWPADTPIALICQGSHPQQVVVAGTLEGFPGKVKRLKNLLSAPAMIVAGEVVGLRDRVSASALEFDILPLAQLKAHEETIPERIAGIREDILKSGQMLAPLWVERKSFVVLNGHHRLAALKDLGCSWASCLLFDYSSPYVEVQVCPGAKVNRIDKDSILQAALSGRPFPPRSSLHVLSFDPPDFPTPLSFLKEPSPQSLEV